MAKKASISHLPPAQRREATRAPSPDGTSGEPRVSYRKSDFWTSRRTDYLKWRWAEGATQQEITAEFGLSKDRVGLVAGKLASLGLRRQITRGHDDAILRTEPNPKFLDLVEEITAKKGRRETCPKLGQEETSTAADQSAETATTALAAGDAPAKPLDAETSQEPVAPAKPDMGDAGDEMTQPAEKPDMPVTTHAASVRRKAPHLEGQIKALLEDCGVTLETLAAASAKGEAVYLGRRTTISAANPAGFLTNLELADIQQGLATCYPEAARRWIGRVSPTGRKLLPDAMLLAYSAAVFVPDSIFAHRPSRKQRTGTAEYLGY